ncbi:zinc ribbon domain-containing protein [Mycolicibacterium gadium]|uniref:zinc ribbon domain-containing protein n=1 Tax=Mycolicibacterium gadium TaxID=1794 RepID=UPI002FDE8520
MGDRRALGVPVERDRVTLELIGVIFPCHRVGSSRFPQHIPGIERVQHTGSSPLIVADRFYASSKLCSGCGATKAKLRLSERVYHCETCGVTLDRDLNAARNLAALASQAAGGTSSPSCGATLNEPAGNPQKAGQVGSGYRHGKPRVGNAA